MCPKPQSHTVTKFFHFLNQICVHLHTLHRVMIKDQIYWLSGVWVKRTHPCTNTTTVTLLWIYCWMPVPSVPSGTTLYTASTADFWLEFKWECPLLLWPKDGNVTQATQIRFSPRYLNIKRKTIKENNLNWLLTTVKSAHWFLCPRSLVHFFFEPHLSSV